MLSDMNLTTRVETARDVEVAAPGWTCTWLPRHGMYLAYMDVLVPPGMNRPAVAEPDAARTLDAIRDTERLRDHVREWIKMHRGEAK